MADTSTIEWTDATWNIITGCTLVDEGCRHCYAARMAATWPALANHPSRKGLARVNAAGEAKFTGEVRFNEQWLDQPLRWKKPRCIFVCAHGDLFHESVPDEWIDRVFAVMALAPHHTFQVLTKRPDRVQAYLTAPGDGRGTARGRVTAAWRVNRLRGKGSGNVNDVLPWPLPNVWLGTSISDQTSADARIPYLLTTPAAVRFLSVEPLLGPVDLTYSLTRWCVRCPPWEQPCRIGCENRTGIDWVIVGGESGPKARPMHPDWARALRDQCQAAGVAFFFKQWGEWCPKAALPPDDPMHTTTMGELAGRVHMFSQQEWSFRIGKARAGRLLDGVEWSQMPGPRNA